MPTTENLIEVNYKHPRLMNDLVFVSVAVSDQRYIEQQARLKQSILDIYPDANLQFYTNEYPAGSRDYFDSMYGFKPVAIDIARKDFTRVVWVDTAIILVDKLDRIIDRDIVVTKDDNKLYQYISNRCLAYNNLTRSEVQKKGWHLCGGSFYYFDFASPFAVQVFEDWKQMEKDGIFGSQYEEASEQLQGHRHDEACMAVALYKNGLEPITCGEAGYNCEKNPITIKRHFK